MAGVGVSRSETASVGRGSFAGRLGSAVASGVLAASAFPPLDLGWVAFIGWVPLLLDLTRVRPGEAAWLGFAGGLSFYLATIWWVINTMTTYGGMPLALSLVALLLLSAVLAGYTAGFAWLLATGARRCPLPAWLWPTLAAVLWTALEFARTYLFSGFPWALLGYTQYREPTVRLLAAAVGVYGVSALVLLVNATLAGVLGQWVRGADGSSSRRDAWISAAVAGVAVLATFGYARVVWQDPTGGPAVRVGLLQGNIEQAVKWDKRFQVATLETYERLAGRVAAERPALIVWPETAVPFFLRREPELGPRVGRFVADTGVPMLIGSPDAGADGRLYNTAFLVGTDGRILGRYDKRHLVPFGEYVPLQRVFFFLDKLVTGIGDFGRGRKAAVFEGAGPPFSVMICYEVIFPAEVREFVRAGATFLVNITNDAWFGRSGAPSQHLAMAAMRAVENGSYLVRAANTGISAVIGPTGEILSRTGLFEEAALAGTIRPRQAETPYTRYGDVLAWVCLVCSIGYGAMLVWAARRGSPRTAAGL
jgi:apolipoprotein N-acyltransferase